jgi:hypothetical protein
MSTPTSIVHGNELPEKESGFYGRMQAAGTASLPQITAAKDYDMSPRARKIIYLTLLAGVLFLGSVAAYVWYGFYLWRNIP